MTIIEAFILGLVQGLTEFLPVSSSGHIELGSALLNVQTTNNLLFSVVVHSATALSTIVIFRKDLWKILRDLTAFEYNEATRYTICILISMLPIAIIGILFDEQIESFFSGEVMLVGFMLLLTGLLLAMTYYSKGTGGPVTYTKALLIGVAQAISILPGISRSGATISTALLLGVDKEKAARFSFLMVLLPILGGSFLKLLEFLKAPAEAGGISGMALVVGFSSAFIAGLAACKWMIAIVKRGKLIYFAIYCFMVGTFAIITFS